jgi:cell wall-associated NlpC family hydrolase
MMHYKTILTGVIGLVLLTGCESLRRITAKDNSTAIHKTRKTARKNVEFINDIEVTPGSSVTSKHRTASSKHLTQQEIFSYTAPDPDFKNANIEKADWLQLKYAVIMDATVEKLANIPLLQKMEEWWGTKYCMGGNSKSCIDCSAFTQAVMADVYKVNLPRTAQEQYDMSEKLEDIDIKEGDLVFFHTGGRRSKDISHVGIYITNNKFANASTSGGVTISDLNDPYWKIRYKGAGRVIKG